MLEWTCPVCGDIYTIKKLYGNRSLFDDGSYMYDKTHPFSLGDMMNPCYKCQESIDEHLKKEKEYIIEKLKKLGD